MASASDSFDRADGAIGANWGNSNGSWVVRSNSVAQATVSAAYFKTLYTATAPATNDHYSEAVCRAATGATESVGPCVRAATSTTATFYGYIPFGGDFSYIVEITAGAETILATGSAVTAATDYTLRLTASGTSLTGTRNGGADISTTDASLTSGGWGLCAYNGTASGTATSAASWNGADTTNAASLPPLPARMPPAILAR